MKKSSTIGTLISVLGLGVYNLCVFLIVTHHTNGFWISYIFTSIAFMAQLVVFLIVDKSNANTQFLRLPLFYIVGGYFALQLVVGIMFMLIPTSATFPLIVQVIILAAFLTVTMTVTIAKEQILKTEENINNASFNLRTLTINAEQLYLAEVNGRKKAELKKLYEAIRYSDPVSISDATRNLDDQIDTAFRNLSLIIDSCSESELEKEMKPILDLLTKRNLLCKSGK